ncbi:MAG: hypothetical protein PF541_00920 [Prolixibacteraceae bacterium]|jgi:hypothetical protein|nr:hypothetical protein [Prolixibacteraceae bacterium]
MLKKLITLTLFSIILNSTFAQLASIDGYVKDMQGIYIFEKAIPSMNGEEINTLSYNLVHNRLNFKLYPTNNLTLTLELRSRVFSGKLLEQIPGYASIVASDNGLIDLSWNLVEEDKYFINTAIDRIYIDYTIGNFQLRAGRQRINWGINLVWNPNDIFNAFSYIDFDYEERPGSDAILATWYPSMSSSVDLAYKASDTISNRAFAAKYRFNKYNYDFQLLAGQAGHDFVIGGGWSGNIWNFGFRGEASYFKPMNDYATISDEAFTGSISLDYSFPKSLHIHTSFLYNSLGSINGESFSLIDPNMQLSAKKLSMGKYELFGQVSYPIGSLVNISAAAMLNPVDKSAYIGPSFSVSLQDNLELYLTSQIMLGDEGSEYGSMGNLYAVFGRLRWSF